MTQNMTDALSPEEIEILSDPESDLIERAMAHYHRECIENGWLYQQPGTIDSFSYGIRYRDFVDVANSNGSLAFYELVNGELVRSSEAELDQEFRDAGIDISV